MWYSSMDIPLWITILLGGLTTGVACGLLPFVAGFWKCRIRRGQIGLFWCLLSGLLAGVLLAMPVGVFMLVVVLRGIQVRWWRVCLGLGLLALVACSTFFMIRINAGNPVTISEETTHLTEPLDGDGHVDYLAAINRRYSENVTPDNNAAVLLWQILGPPREHSQYHKQFFEGMGISPLPAEGNYWAPLEPQSWNGHKPWHEVDEEELFPARMQPWSGEDFPALAAWLEANEGHLDRAIEATKRSRFFTPCILPNNLRILLPALNFASDEYRELARGLTMRTMLRVEEGDIKAAWQDLLACRRLARLIGQGPSIIDALVSTTLDGWACYATYALAEHGRLTPEQAKRFVADLDRLPPMPDFAERLDVWERYTFLSGISNIANHGPTAVSSDPMEEDSPGNRVAKFAVNSLVDWNDILHDGNEACDLAVAFLRETDEQERNEMLQEAWDARKLLHDNRRGNEWHEFGMGAVFGAMRTFGLGRRWADHLALVLWPSHYILSSSGQRAETCLRLAPVTIALAGYRAEHGSYPKRLADLVPQYLTTLPNDPFGKGPFRYIPQQDGFVLYSVGQDGRDDKGRPQAVRHYNGHYDIPIFVPYRQYVEGDEYIPPDQSDSSNTASKKRIPK